ncbi:MAG: hypothetical protein DHS20C16_16420 [Phycisphaerae bacterium]|nr:MAG: hypothetical protein DHS20C16_16420 [Phycisphaerae bacterium]
MREKSARIMPVLATMVLVAMSNMSANADMLQVNIENTQSSGQFFFTPFWIAAHNGQFDSYNSGEMAPAFLTPLAELGSTAEISDAFSMSPASGGAQGTVTAVSGMGDAPVFSPGESTTFNLDVSNPSQNRYFSYASMVIPSNDLFVANGNPMEHEVFDSNGDFAGPVVIEIYGQDANDNGSEVNDAFGGAAFSANGGASVGESFAIRSLFSDGGDAAYLNSFVGTQTANGATIGSAFGPSDLIARITITPEPASVLLLGVGGAMVLRRRKKTV